MECMSQLRIARGRQGIAGLTLLDAFRTLAMKLRRYGGVQRMPFEINPAFKGQEWFATTHWSVVLAAGERQSPHFLEALEKLCRTYWYPVYVYVRRQGHDAHEAQDLTQEFFARLLEKNYLSDVDRAKGKFRSFLIASLNHFLANEWDKAKAQKRGGGQKPISLDDETAENRYTLEPVSQCSPEKIFDQRWALTLMNQALTRLCEEFVAAGKNRQFEVLKVFLEDETSAGDYAAVADELRMTPAAVAMAVSRLRQRYRDLLVAEIAQTVGSEAEIEEEMRYLFESLSTNP
jgi:RNA polymerase sigma factor (sigma-70 family)